MGKSSVRVEPISNPTRDQVKDIVLSTVAEVLKLDKPVDPKSSFFHNKGEKSLDCDYLDFLDIELHLEDRFADFRFDVNKELPTVEDMIDYVCNQAVKEG